VDPPNEEPTGARVGHRLRARRRNPRGHDLPRAAVPPVQIEIEIRSTGPDDNSGVEPCSAGEVPRLRIPLAAVRIERAAASQRRPLRNSAVAALEAILEHPPGSGELDIRRIVDRGGHVVGVDMHPIRRVRQQWRRRHAARTAGRTGGRVTGSRIQPHPIPARSIRALPPEGRRRAHPRLAVERAVDRRRAWRAGAPTGDRGRRTASTTRRGGRTARTAARGAATGYGRRTASASRTRAAPADGSGRTAG